MRKKKVVVAMSGGVDSAVAAALFKEAGFSVSGVIMKIYDDSISHPEGSRHACFGPGEQQDVEDAQKAADQLRIPLHVVDLQGKYRESVLDYFIQEYVNGNTPNPCARCNREMKFSAIVDELKKMDVTYDYFVTGHYARIEHNRVRNQFSLKKGVDLKKDQSYFLYYLKSRELRNYRFPLGRFTKAQVRELALGLGLQIANKAESQDFIAGGYSQLLAKHAVPGPIVTVDGEVVGQHKGIVFYTVGQRRGIGLANHKPLYVVAKDRVRNAIIVGNKDDLWGTDLVAGELNWIEFAELSQPIQVKAKIRYQHPEASAQVTPLAGRRVQVKFDKPQIAITPGQVVVFYQGDTVVGGGIIEKEGRHE